jgi:hypothetical protein
MKSHYQDSRKEERRRRVEEDECTNSSGRNLTSEYVQIKDLNNYSKSSNGKVQTHWKFNSHKTILSRSSHTCYTYAEALYKFIKEMKAHRNKIPIIIEAQPTNITISSGNILTSVLKILGQERQIWEKRDCFSI